MRSLIVAPNWIGDAVMAQPLVAQVRETSDAVDVLAPRATAAVFRSMSAVTEVIEFDFRHGRLQLAARLAMAGRLRRRHYGRAYVLPNSFKSALIPFLAGIPERHGHRGEFRYGVLNRTRSGAPASEQPMVEFYAQLAPHRDDAVVPDPVLDRDNERETAARRRFNLGSGSFIVLAPGAEYGPAKRWPPRHFASLANRIAHQWTGIEMALLGGPKDRQIATEIRALAGLPLRNLCGETSLDEAFALIAQAAGVISNDSGLMHVAAAYGVPQVAVFGSSDPRHTPPRSPRAKIQWLHLECSPCFARQCPLGHTNCLNDIAPANVFAALRQVLHPITSDGH